MACWESGAEGRWRIPAASGLWSIWVELPETKILGVCCCQCHGVVLTVNLWLWGHFGKLKEGSGCDCEGESERKEMELSVAENMGILFCFRFQLNKSTIQYSRRSLDISSLFFFFFSFCSSLKEWNEIQCIRIGFWIIYISDRYLTFQVSFLPPPNLFCSLHLYLHSWHK